MSAMSTLSDPRRVGLKEDLRRSWGIEVGLSLAPLLRPELGHTGYYGESFTHGKSVLLCATWGYLILLGSLHVEATQISSGESERSCGASTSLNRVILGGSRVSYSPGGPMGGLRSNLWRRTALSRPAEVGFLGGVQKFFEQRRKRVTESRKDVPGRRGAFGRLSARRLCFRVCLWWLISLKGAALLVSL